MRLQQRWRKRNLRLPQRKRKCLRNVVLRVLVLKP
jgi:hypothetical protein